MKKVACIILFLISGFYMTKAQSTVKRDTINYLLDIEKTPERDRVWFIEDSKTSRFLTLACACMTDGRNIGLGYRFKDRATVLTKSAMKGMALKSLAEFIKILERRADDARRKNVVINLIEPEKNKFIMHEVSFYIKRKDEPTIDAVTIYQ